MSASTIVYKKVKVTYTSLHSDLLKHLCIWCSEILLTSLHAPKSSYSHFIASKDYPLSAFPQSLENKYLRNEDCSSLDNSKCREISLGTERIRYIQWTRNCYNLFWPRSMVPYFHDPFAHMVYYPFYNKIIKSFNIGFRMAFRARKDYSAPHK